LSAAGKIPLSALRARHGALRVQLSGLSSNRRDRTSRRRRRPALASARELDRRLQEVSDEMSRLNPDRRVVAASASRLGRWSTVLLSGSP